MLKRKRASDDETKKNQEHHNIAPLSLQLRSYNKSCDGFEETSRNLEVFSIKLSRNERRTCLTKSTVSINNGQKTKLDSNFILALELSYWPINQMPEVNSTTHRNLIPTSTDLQLKNSIVSRPYMILMKTENRVRDSELRSTHLSIKKFLAYL